MLLKTELAKNLDVTLVRNCNTAAEIANMIEASAKYRFACVFTMQCYIEEVARGLAAYPDVHIGGIAGFPSGSELTTIKEFETKTCLALGANEVDMVINLGFLKSGRYDAIRDEIKSLKAIVGDERPLKCIIEMSCLTEDEAKRACELVVAGGADYVKTGTGWFGPATVEGVKLIKSVVGDACHIKAAGGIRTTEQANALLDAGAYRLGVGLSTALQLMEGKA